MRRPGTRAPDAAGSRTTRPVDVALAVGLALLAAAEVAVPFPTVMGSGSAWLAGAAGVLSALGLVLRRSRPVLAVAVVVAPWSVLAVAGPVLVLFWGGLAPMAVAVHSLARHAHGPARLVGLAAAAGATVLLDVRSGMAGRPGELFFHWTVLVAAGAAGAVIGHKEAGAAALERRAEQVAADGLASTAAALAAERARIARELHDVVAHAVTAIVVQAGAAQQVVEDDPAYVRDSLDRIRRTGTGALDEMRRVVTLLRVNGDDEPLGPQPGLADVPRLVEGSRSARTDVLLRVEGTPRRLAPGPDLAAYRIVQEALTNVHRHAGASEVSVTVRYDRSSVGLEVSDNGDGRPDGRPATGHGLLGMRERATMYGGRLEVTSTPGRGFLVSASLPVTGES